MFTYRPSAGEAETGRSPQFCGQPTLPGELPSSERHGLKNQNEQLLQNNFMAVLSVFMQSRFPVQERVSSTKVGFLILTNLIKIIFHRGF